MVKLLLSSGADANMRDHKGCTAFDLASLMDSSPDMVRTALLSLPLPVGWGVSGGSAGIIWWMIDRLITYNAGD